MTVSTTTRRAGPYAGDGVTTAFTVPFKFLTATSLGVYLSNVLQSSGYSVAGAGAAGGGTVTFSTAPAVGVTVTILGAQLNTQDTIIPPSGPFPAVTVETMADKGMIGVQELQQQLNRALLGAPSDPDWVALVSAINRLDRVLGFNSTTGQPEMSPFTMTQVASVIGAIYAAAAGPLDALSFIQSGIGAVSRTAQNKAREVFSVKDFGATGDGVTDDTTACQLALTAGAGKTVLFPPGDYLLSDALRVGAATCVTGAGYGSRIMARNAGWSLSTTDHYGLLNVKGVDNVRITNLRLYGTKTQDNGHTPKLVYFETANDLTVDHCWLENSAFEGVWSGGTAANSRRIIIAHNHVTNVGYPAGTFVGLPAIQPNCVDVIVIGNELYDVGGGIGPSGYNLVVSGNFIRGVTTQGISTGDGGAYGNASITGNTIEFTADATTARIGIQLGAGSSTSESINCSGNTIRVIGAAGIGNGRGIRASGAADIGILNNVIEIFARGIGIELFGTAAGVTAHAAGNVVRIAAEAGISYGLTAIPNAGGNTLTLTSANNRVYGTTRAVGSYAIDYNASGGGTLNASCVGDLITEGNFRIGSVNYAAGQVDNKPIYMRSDLTVASGYHAAPQIGMVNLSSASAVTIAAGVITLAGTAASTELRRSRVTVDTEGGAGTDDLDTINGTQDGDMLILKAANAARTVVAKDGTGNLKLAGDFSMDNSEDRLMLINDGGTLYELSRSDNGA